ncbi:MULTISPECIES: BTAD domain-containing putative transcriptional regulator [Streptomyces]|uniref:AfsR/SARP family transcriptional regulator n=1 Tax=Streptomyces koelreuteriae TaxID=2838015 RepID=A0ABX8FJF6_9ACTN|nr:MULTISPECIES: BTAD domain-containing putative transcriptional regulator [Streptomyces]QWB21261.1 AfsR/SARP family transcriptional regulator [Streptomyces koelreuteriae]UUA04177.1 AfsR/SARP family transcriptional regulator [Streptomyces koelreuteriae]UUA11803.1 AfsR/SARP family transcriptional regulator [Streptomyces sp. CRCS-T-1]
MTTDLTLLPRVSYRGQEVTAPRLRGLLALLAGDLRTGCSTERLVAGLWPDALPERPGKALQVLVSRARAQLGADVIAGTPTGYRLTLAEDQVDSSALLRHAAAGADRARAGDHAGSLAAAEAGLALWEGTADQGGDSDDPVAALRTDRAPVRATLVRARALALARLGRHAEAAGPLAAVASERPRDEEVLAELLRAEAATAGPSAALTRYEAYRRELRDELGTDPGAGLKAVQRELLRGEAPAVRHGVPHEPNPLLGRDEDIAAVERLLSASRAVTVAGPGGLGKTRLAHAVSRRAEQRVVYFVPLAGVTADADVTAEVASALGAGEGRPGAALSGHDPVSGILGVLGPGPALLVLDNCEQIVRGAADLVQALVSASKDLRVLVTSRAPLGLTSEAVYALPELGLATSVELFTQRARAARPGVHLPPDAVAELCRQLDGLPLAVELAAARVRVLSVPDIARRLGDRFALLRGGVRSVPERHRTLHAVVDWSWNLLDEEARAALRLLSVFPGGFTGEAADQVLGEDALFLLEQLADQSLLTVADTPAGVRFRMLETVREFSAARRAEAGEDEEAVRRFLVWARDFGVAHHDWFFGSGPLSAWERIRAEQDNLVSALRHALARTDGPTIAALTAVLTALWSTGSNFTRLTTLAADTGPPLSHYHPEPEYVEVARSAAVLSTATLFMGYGPHVVRQLVTLRRLPPAPPDTLVRAIAVVLGAVPEMRPPDYEVLRQLCDSEQPLLAGIAECVATYVWEYEHDIDRAHASARRIIAALAPVDNPFLQVIGHARLGELCLRTERGDAAYEHLKAALEALPRLGDEHDSLGIRSGLVLACLHRGDPDEAEYWLRQAEGHNAQLQDDFHSPGLGGRAEIALARGLTEVGLGLWRSAVEGMAEAGPMHSGDPFLDRWVLQIQSAAVTAHAHVGRLEPVAEVVDGLRQELRTMLDGPAGSPMELRYGTVLHALGMAGLVSGDASAVRMIALAERLRVLRDYQPTMSAARARQAAEKADRAAYADAVSEYAALERNELRDAARAVMAVASTSGRG